MYRQDNFENKVSNSNKKNESEKDTSIIKRIYFLNIKSKGARAWMNMFWLFILFLILGSLSGNMNAENFLILIGVVIICYLFALARDFFENIEDESSPSKQNISTKNSSNFNNNLNSYINKLNKRYNNGEISLKKKYQLLDAYNKLSDDEKYQLDKLNPQKEDLKS